MSVNGDVQVGITQCLAQITQAFNDGGAIIEKIKRNRALKRAPPPPRLLEESIDQAPHEIEKEKQRGITRFGTLFEEGDHEAVIRLQQVTIQLQAALLEKLRNAAFDDDTKITDFTYLVDAVDSGRDKVIAALNELKQRLVSAGQPPEPQFASPNSSRSTLELPTPIAEPRSRSSTDRSQSVHVSQPAAQQDRSLSVQASDTPSIRSSHERAHVMAQPSQKHLTPSDKQRTWTRDFSHSKDHSGEEDAAGGAEENQSYPHHKKRNSLLHFLKHTRTHSASDKDKLHAAIPEEPNRSTTTSPPGPTSASFQPPPMSDTSSTHELTHTNSNSRFTYEEWEDNPQEIWGNKPNIERRETVALAPDAQSEMLVRQISNPLAPPSPVLTNRSNSNAMSMAGHMAAITAIPTPNPENEFLGLCKSSWKLQNGDRKGAFHKCKDVEPWSRHPSSYAAAAQYLACTTNKCAFRSNFTCMDAEIIWSKVFTSEAKGIRFRWTFLAKSHVSQKVAVKHQYSFNCLFCVFTTGRSGVYHGTDYYLQHISSEHRGQKMGEIILYKTGCIQDRKAEDTEEFDINLWPVDNAHPQAQKDRQTSQWLNDDLMWSEGGYNPREANDSMFSANEPWNEGLSDFSYRGEFDHELE